MKPKFRGSTWVLQADTLGSRLLDLVGSNLTDHIIASFTLEFIIVYFDDWVLGRLMDSRKVQRLFNSC